MIVVALLIAVFGGAFSAYKIIEWVNEHIENHALSFALQISGLGVVVLSATGFVNIFV